MNISALSDTQLPAYSGIKQGRYIDDRSPRCDPVRMATKQNSKTPTATKRRYTAAENYAMCRELIDGGMAVTSSFAAVADRTGRSPATVHTAYYAHQRRATAPPSSTRQTKPDRARPRTDRDAQASLQLVATHIAEQTARIIELGAQLDAANAEISALRRKAQRYDAMIIAARK